MYCNILLLRFGEIFDLFIHDYVITDDSSDTSTALSDDEDTLIIFNDNGGILAVSGDHKNADKVIRAYMCVFFVLRLCTILTK